MTRSRQTTVAALAVVVLGLAAIVLTEAVIHHRALAGLDGPFRDQVIDHRNGFLTEVMVNASRFGSTPSLIVIALAAGAWLVWRGRKGDSLLVVGGSAGALALGPVLKAIVERPRPALSDHVVFVHSWSYPSGHSLNSMAVLGLLTVLAVRERPGAVRRTALAALGVFLVVVVGFSRVYLGVHWPSDVLAGWLIGLLWLTTCFAIAHLTGGNTRASGTVPGSS
ncbi:phosphatase PAP2 family protein [Actinophytocola glycyrrhizae]|uniref:Phosphatase PAP2 family protein n=1 Tax=Actinophytocola glycyrrhizae TaxID=2044873 RepID=A0ABV9S1L7_9PSEU